MCSLTNDTGVCRIAGNAAKDVDIYQSVCEQMERTFAKSKWKVSSFVTCDCKCDSFGSQLFVNLIEMKHHEHLKTFSVCSNSKPSM